MRRWLWLVLAGIVLMLFITREHDEVTSTEEHERTTEASTGTVAHAAALEPALPVVDEATGEATAERGAATLQRLEGLVVDSDDHPVGGARVSIGPGRAVVTEGDGSFAFDGLVAGQYSVIAERDGWYAEEQDVRLDDDTEPVTLQLALGVTLVVRIVDEAGGPIAGANLHVSGRDYKTGADGIARARGVDLEGEMVAITAPGHAGARERIDTGDDPTVTIEKTFTLTSGAEISGTVVDQAGARVADAHVELESSLTGRSENAWTDEQGVWRIPDLGRGTYIAKASSNAALSANDLTLPHDGTHALAGIELRVAPGGEIEGDVIDERGKPVSGARVSGGSVSEMTDDAGHFVARGLAADTYTLGVSTPTSGAVDQVVKLAKGQKARVRFVVVPSSIAGVVVDARGQPVEDASVAARSEKPEGFGFGRTDERGRFDLGGLPPGRYQVTVSRPSSRVDSKPIEVATGTRDVRLVALDPAAVTGRVVLDGVPVPYFGVAIVSDPTDDYSRPRSVRDPNGRFLEKDPEPGTYAVVIVGPSFARTVVPNVRVVPGQTTDLGDIAVTRGDVLRGRVVDETGAGVAGAKVALGTGSYASSPLGMIMRGARSATTDANGAFEIVGMPAGDEERTLEATHPTRGASSPLVVRPDERVVEIAIRPTGKLEGQVLPAKRDLYLAVARRTDQPGRYTVDIDRNGMFSFPQLPPGEYELGVVGESIEGEPRVTIQAGATARAMLVLAQPSGSE